MNEDKRKTEAVSALSVMGGKRIERRHNKRRRRFFRKLETGY
jgi:hypothetical protein